MTDVGAVLEFVVKHFVPSLTKFLADQDAHDRSLPREAAGTAA
jgi:hypothetical protein